MRFDVETHDPGALFSMNAKRQRGLVVTEANDAAGWQATNRRDARSVAAPDTKPQGNAASWHD